MRKKYNTIKGVCLLGFICLLILEYIYFQNTISTSLMGTESLQFALLFLIALVIFCTRKLYTNRIIILPLILCAHMTLITICMKTQSSEPLAMLISKVILWYLVFALGFFSARNGVKKEYFSVLAVVLMIALEIKYWGALSFDFSIKNKDYVLTSVYYILCCIPYVMLISNRKIKNLLLLSGALATIVSLKRSAMLVLIICALVLFLRNNSNLTKVKRKVVIAAFCILIPCVAFLPSILDTFNSAFVALWKSRVNSGSSDRYFIYVDVWRRFCDSGFFEMLFGHGQNAVLYTSSYGLSAHNDFLEILFDYGMIGFAYYIAFLWALIRSVKETRRSVDLDLENGYICAITIFLVASFPSHMITYSTYFLLLSTYLGYTNGILSQRPKGGSDGTN